MTTSATSRFIVLGVNDDQDFCQCCGRNGLKRVVWIEDTETQDVRHFGTTCATQPAKGFPKDEIKKAIAEHTEIQNAAWSMVHREIRRLGLKIERYDYTTMEPIAGTAPAETYAKRAELFPIMLAKAKAQHAELAAWRAAIAK